MDKVITMTPGGLIAGFLAICAGIRAVATAASWLIKAIKAVKAPTKAQDDRLDALEETVQRHEEYFSTDKTRLDAFEEGNRITQRALLALLAHGIDGNAVEAMEKAKEELTNHLIER